MVPGHRGVKEHNYPISDVGQSGFCSSFCGWHTYKFAWIGIPPSGCNCFAQSVSPNGNAGLDTAINTIGHELAETATDPLMNAWYYTSTSTGIVENGDQCAWYFPNSTTLSNGAKYNLVVNGTKYYVQANWNLKTLSCTMS